MKAHEELIATRDKLCVLRNETVRITNYQNS